MQTTNQALDQLLYAMIAVMRRKGGTTISVENAREIIHDIKEQLRTQGWTITDDSARKQVDEIIARHPAKRE